MNEGKNPRECLQQMLELEQPLPSPSPLLYHCVLLELRLLWFSDIIKLKQVWFLDIPGYMNFPLALLSLLWPVVMISMFKGKMTTIPVQLYVELKWRAGNAGDREKRLVRTQSQHCSIPLEWLLKTSLSGRLPKRGTFQHCNFQAFRKPAALFPGKSNKHVNKQILSPAPP